MSFADPAWLWLLVPLALLLALRVWLTGRTSVEVSTLVLWRRLLEGAERPRRGRVSLPLDVVLEAATGGVLVVALAGPAGRGAERPAELVIVRDAGPAMQAPARRAAADAVCGRLRRESGLAQGAVRVVEIPVAGRGGQGPGTSGLEWTAVLGGRRRPGRRLALVADAVADADALADDVEVAVVDAPLANAGFVAYSLARDGEGRPERAWVGLAASRAFGEREVAIVTGDGRRFRVAVRSDATSGVEIPWPPRASGEDRVDELALRIEVEDDIAADDVLTLIRRPLAAGAAVDADLPALEDAVSAAGLEVTLVLPSATTPAGSCRIGRSLRGASRALLIPPAIGAAVALGDPAAVSSPLTPVAPYLADLPLANLRVGVVRPLRGEGVEPLLVCGGHVVAGWVPAAGQVVLGVDPDTAGWTGHPAFPVLVRGFLEQLGVTAGWAATAAHRAGEPIVMSVDGAAPVVTGPVPPGVSTRLEPDGSGRAVYTPGRVGRHELRDGARRIPFSVALLDRGETLGHATPDAARKAVRRAAAAYRPRSWRRAAFLVAAALAAALVLVRWLRAPRG